MNSRNFDIETQISYITKLGVDMVRVEVKKNIEAKVEDLEENYRAYQQLFGDNCKLFVLIVFNQGANASSEVRNKFAETRSDFKLAEALVVNSLPHRIIANFVFKVQKPRHKMHVFNNEDEALIWLKKQKANTPS
jgi:hypothetical protein